MKTIAEGFMVLSAGFTAAILSQNTVSRVAMPFITDIYCGFPSAYLQV
jgi:hypothetical protein